MKKSFSRTFTLANRNLKEILRDPLSLTFILVVPLLMEIVFYFIFHGMTDQFQMKFLAPGIVIFAQAFLTLFTGLLIATDRGSSFLTRLYVSKAKSHEFILSYALSVLPIALIQSILFFLVGGIIDPLLFGVGMVYSILLSLVTSLFFIAFGILFGSICNEKSVGGVSSIVITGQSILSGMWFPLEGISQGMLVVMKILPFRNATLLVQNVITGIENTFNDFVLPLLIVLAYTIFLFGFAIFTFKKNMKVN